MKAIRVMIDERLLRELDATDEVQREGRSAVLRRAITDYLRHRRSRDIREAYERAYASASDLGSRFEGWEDQGTWPEE